MVDATSEIYMRGMGKMISITKLLCDSKNYGDNLRYVEGASTEKYGVSPGRGPVVAWNCTKTCNLKCKHCYASAEALYHLLGGKSAGYVACVASFEENNEKFTHWWIKNNQNEIIDPTAEQFTSIGKEPPYSLGKNAGFLTKNPSKRAQIIIQRVFENFPEQSFLKKLKIN